MKPKLLILELWGLGDLVIATPFLREASRRYAVTVVSKPFGLDLQPRLWPQVRVVPFVAPWTAFKRKYRFWHWPWRPMIRLVRALASEHFEAGASARWDPRDHFLLRMVGARARYGFPRLKSDIWLTHPLPRPDPISHRYESWRTIGRALGLELPERDALNQPPARRDGAVLVHTGAGQAIRVWPLERYRDLVTRLRAEGHFVQVACDPDQRAWWLQQGESQVATPRTVTELLDLLDRAAVFVGNDSGPGHLAAFCGVPTFTLFGPQVPEWFVPLHPQAELIEGKPCPYKPCFDYCRMPAPQCLLNLDSNEVQERVLAFVARHLTARPAKPVAPAG
ncbi:MAG: glycosyltransferase family 9 protein [Verrucomicrobiae bacterium]|nr:glycosyltransferase family 9 protein [Verrucomicrobiae bacterium]MDW8309422.1 glycosyltransferase family 9 protein [Verrucomicrobiales bacterium]